MGPGLRGLLLKACVLALPLTVAVGSAPAQALSPPDVFLQELDASDQPTGGWIPLQGAHMRSVNGYEIGVRLQNTGQPGNPQRFLVQVTSVPDGHPDQKNIYSLCFKQTGNAGDIVKPDERVRYEGDGTYALAVTVSIGSDASTACAVGATTTASFTASAPTTVRFVGHMLAFDPSAHHRFGGLEIVPAFGAGETKIRCALDPRPASDGSLTGRRVIDRDGVGSQESPSRLDAGELFKQVGHWACVARSVSGGVTAGPWSAPTRAEDVQTGFLRPADGAVRLVDPRGPTYRMAERFNPLTAGGVLTVVIRRSGKREASVRLKTRIRRGGLASFKFRVPFVAGSDDFASFIESIGFGGTRFIASRAPFGDLGITAQRTPSGRLDLSFPAPCSALRC
jgi:hypothetical protein